MAKSGLRLAMLAIAAATLLQITVAQTTHIVGDALGWLVPPGGPIVYRVWADSQTFAVGDVLGKYIHKLKRYKKFSTTNQN